MRIRDVGAQKMTLGHGCTCHRVTRSFWLNNPIQFVSILLGGSKVYGRGFIIVFLIIVHFAIYILRIHKNHPPL